MATLLIRGQSERRSAFAVRAFNVEIAKIAGSVNNNSFCLCPLCICHCLKITKQVHEQTHVITFQVSEPKLAEIRLKFWSDALNKIYDKDNKGKALPEHPVITEVNNVSIYSLHADNHRTST